MRLFALIWTALFLVMIVPIMRKDRMLHLRRLMVSIQINMDALEKIFINFGDTTKLAQIKINEFGRAISGIYHTAVGYDSLPGATTGMRNVAIGYNTIESEKEEE